ncbi:MAG: diguanylate cyclase, partial [Gammaproteobacteria bacterium]|nr:diguanylate cyclase [Gammaproteobacteria bacterium]
DVDRFRNINDTAGHAVGDRVLTAVSRILGGVIRPGDTIGRLGNDEFGIVFHEVPRAEQVSRLVSRVADRFPERVEIE